MVTAEARDAAAQMATAMVSFFCLPGAMDAMTSLADVNCGCLLLDLWLSLFVGMRRRGQSLLSSVLMMLIRQ